MKDLTTQAKETAQTLGLTENKSKELEAIFVPIVSAIEKIDAEYNAIVSSTEITEELTEKAKALRLAIVKIRTGADKKRKEEKQAYLTAGRAIDGIFNIIKYAVESKEKKLKPIEDYFIIREQRKKQSLINAQRERMITIRNAYPNRVPGTVDVYPNLDTEPMGSGQFEVYLSGLKEYLQSELREQKRQAEEEESERQAAELKCEREEEEREKERIMLKKLADEERKKREAAEAVRKKERMILKKLADEERKKREKAEDQLAQEREKIRLADEEREAEAARLEAENRNSAALERAADVLVAPPLASELDTVIGWVDAFLDSWPSVEDKALSECFEELRRQVVSPLMGFRMLVLEIKSGKIK